MAGHDGIGYSADSPILDLAAAIVKAAVDDYVKTLRNLWSRNLDIKRKRKLIIEKTMLEELCFRFVSRFFIKNSERIPTKHLLPRQYMRGVVLEPEQVEEQSSPLPKEFLQRAEEGLEKNLQRCHKNAKTRRENMTPGVYPTLRRRKEDLPWLLSMRN